MGIFDKAKDLLGEHADKVEGGIDKAADVVDERTGHQPSENIDRATEEIKDRVGDYLVGEEAELPPPRVPGPDQPA